MPQSMKVGIQPVGVLVGNASGPKIELHHLGRLPLFQQVEQRVPIVELTDPLSDQRNEIEVQRDHVPLAMLAVPRFDDEERVGTPRGQASIAAHGARSNSFLGRNDTVVQSS